MHPIVWFDIRATDVKRAQRFYSRLFRWKFEQLPGMEYWRINLGGINANLTSTNFGKSTSQLNPRNIQFGARISF